MTGYPTGALYPKVMHGMDGEQYSREYSHSTHLADAIGVFRSDCPACQRHFREAFGPDIERLIVALGTLPQRRQHVLVSAWLADLEKPEEAME